MIFRPPSSELRNSDSAMANISARALTLERSTRSASPVSVVLPLYSHKRRRSQRPSEGGHIRLGKDPGRWQRQKSILREFPCAQCRAGVTGWLPTPLPAFRITRSSVNVAELRWLLVHSQPYRLPCRGSHRHQGACPYASNTQRRFLEP